MWYTSAVPFLGLLVHRTSATLAPSRALLESFATSSPQIVFVICFHQAGEQLDASCGEVFRSIPWFWVGQVLDKRSSCAIMCVYTTARNLLP